MGDHTVACKLAVHKASRSCRFGGCSAAWCAACCLEEGEGQHWRSIWGSIVAHMVVACRSYRPGGHLSNVAQLAT
eukprot:scaffold193264_cov13-Tisochrysis_lutea.AAC.1